MIVWFVFNVDIKGTHETFLDGMDSCSDLSESIG